MTKVPPDEISAFRRTGVFDSAWYLSTYPDVALLNIDPAEHYLWVGRRIGRPPSAGNHAWPPEPRQLTRFAGVSRSQRRESDGFDALSYVLANPDLRALDSIEELSKHWLQHGLQEARIGSGVSPYADRSPWNGALPDRRLNVAFFGPISASSGLGSAARGYANALSMLNINLEVIDTTASLYPEEDGSIASPSSAPDLIILHQNADSLTNLFRFCDRKLLDGVYTIGIWVWELMAFRPQWIEAFGAVDEVWTPSTFVSEAIQAAAPLGVPVRTIPHVVEAHIPVSRYDRSHFGIPDEAFAFLCTFDASSAFERKNPTAVLEAFTEAFNGDPAAFLVMKFHSSHADAAKIAAMRRKYEASNVLFLDVLMSTDELTALRELADCLVSAHRAEGFGLNVAEAMAVGKPVIATAYSGNLSFCDDTNSLLVRASLREVQEGTRHYPAGSVWGQPDHQGLVSAMRRVVADRGAARALGQRAAETIREELGRERVAALITNALEEVAKRGDQVRETWEQRRRLAWRHPGALGSEEFAEGHWPTFSLIVPVQGSGAAVRDTSIEAILRQSYPYWELCICADASANPQTLAYLETLPGRDQRIRLRRLPEPAATSLAITAAAEVATGEFLTFVDLNGAIARDALAAYAFAVAAHPDNLIFGLSEHETHLLTVRKNLFLEIISSDGQQALPSQIARSGRHIVRLSGSS